MVFRQVLELCSRASFGRTAGRGTSKQPQVLQPSDRPKTATVTLAAPAAFKTRAISLQVAPVVRMSSTNRTDAPAKSYAESTAKARRTLRNRCLGVSPGCNRVARVRLSRCRSNGTPRRRAKPVPISIAGLYPRWNCRDQCKGTATAISKCWHPKHSPRSR